MDIASSRAEGKQLGNGNMIGAGGLLIKRVEGPVHIFELKGELDIATAPRLTEELIRSEEDHASQIVIDLSELEFLDSFGIRHLLMACHRAQGNGTTLGFLRGSKAVARILEISGTEERLPFLD